MFVVGVVPVDVVGEVPAGGIDVGEHPRVVRPVFHGPELGLGERIVVTDVRPVVGELDSVGGQLRAGRYPDDTKAAKTARLLRAVADQLDV